MLPFEHLGPYRVGEPIGRGGMGSVFKAVHETTGEQVAVKVIAASVSDEIRFRRRFSSEIETLKKLKHPNIVSLIGHGEQHGQLFYSMELVPGESLQQRLRREKRLQWPFVLDMAIEICNALKHAHNFGVIHRDLKPANLLISTDGTPKLVDFGIAKLFGNVDQTAAGSVLGTADFMAPEQACDGPITPRTDLYALGNVLYACFTGRSPFAGRKLPQVIEALQNESPTPLDLIVPELPNEIVQLVHDLLEKRPEERPPTALAAMNRLKAIRAGLQRQAENAQAEITAKEEQKKNVQPKRIDPLTQAERQTASETPTVFAEERIAPRTAIPMSDLTIAEAESRLNPVTPSTHRDNDYALTGDSIKQRPAVPSSSPTVPSLGGPVAGSLLNDSQPTHFSTIQEGERRRGLWEHEAEPAAAQWTQALSIAAMISVLIAGAGLFVWSMQRPSADEFYQSILTAQQNDDSTEFRSQLDQFKRLYPDDSRLVELEPFLAEMDSARILRRLRVAAVREGGDDHLSPPQQAFLEAMRDIEHDPAKSQTLLRQWLDVYDPTAAGPKYDSSRELQAMAQAAKQELQRLSAQTIPAGDLRAAELIQRIEWGQKNLPQPEFEKMLQGMLGLYGNKPWASAAVVVVRKYLDKTTRP